MRGTVIKMKLHRGFFLVMVFSLWYEIDMFKIVFLGLRDLFYHITFVYFTSILGQDNIA